ncbi:MAG: hypothetical protein EBY38_08740, partial [Flavobacteriaceae bacterium]|nr:hypothetical protein [Flavobacteriaceae bacterium]
NQNGPLSKLNGYESGSFNVGKGIPVDPAFGCPKNFVSSYMCGNAVKNINIEGESVGKRALYDCRDQIDKCKQNQTFATFQNDGNFVLYKGTPEFDAEIKRLKSSGWLKSGQLIQFIIQVLARDFLVQRV